MFFSLRRSQSCSQCLRGSTAGQDKKVEALQAAIRNNKLLVTSASLLVTSALLVVTRSY